MRITLFSIFFLVLILSAFSAKAQEEMAPEEMLPIQAPQTIEEAGEFGIGILKAIPEAIKEVWITKAMPLWAGMLQWAKNLWDSTIYSFAKGIWDKVLSFFGQEIEKRQPYIKEELLKEKEGLKQELEQKIPESGKSLWNRIKGFLPKNETN
ncbi:hypothetical protein KJ708_00305 [bacterium]|nr:hypothetical protein [bacterium]